MIDIDLNSETTIYKSTLDLNPKFSKKIFIDKLKIVESLSNITNPKKHLPGKQYLLNDIYIPELNFIKENIFELISKKFNVSNNFINKTWVYHSNNDNQYSGYHTHEILHPKPIGSLDKLKTNYTFTYYLQMPNNLKNEEGKIFFKTKSGYEYGMLPEENDILIFPGDLEHRPELNPNSTKPRIVIAGNVIFLDEHLQKTEKTFL